MYKPSTTICVDQKHPKMCIIEASIFRLLLFFKCGTAQPFFIIFDSNTEGPGVLGKIYSAKNNFLKGGIFSIFYLGPPYPLPMISARL